MSNNRHKISLFVSVFGVLYCLASAFGMTEVICHTSGCQIYKGYSFLGVSLYIWGAVAFTLSGLFLMFRERLIQRFSFDFYPAFMTVCFLGEIGLLLYQAVYLPCISCLVVGLLWGVLFVLELDGFRCKILPVVALVVWFFLLSGNLVSAGKEMISPWPIYGSADAPVKIFFSPTCPACKEAVKEIVKSGLVDRANLALFPVAKNEEDQHRICLLECSLREDEPDLEMALDRCWQPGCEAISVGLWDKIRMRINLFRNKLALFRMGIRQVPVVISRRPLIGGDSVSDLIDSGEDEVHGCGLSGSSCN